MLLHSALFFGVLAAGTTLSALVPRLISARWPVTVPFELALIGATSSVAAVITGDAGLDNRLALIAFTAVVLTRVWQSRWSWVGAALFATASLAAIAYLAFAAQITYDSVRGPVYFVASTVLLLLEAAALTLSASYLFEIIDVLSRRREPQHHGDPGYLPKVAIQVPAYSEPIEVVSETLKALAKVDYPDLIVQVVDNNTPEEATWRALESLCKELGPRFKFMHLENWPGYKAGALNEANRRLPADVELVGVVDSDYVVNPDWLRAVSTTSQIRAWPSCRRRRTIVTGPTTSTCGGCTTATSTSSRSRCRAASTATRSSSPARWASSG